MADKDSSDFADFENHGAHLAAIVESSDDAIISKKLDGTIRSWNAAAERIFGFTAKEAIGSDIRLLIPPDRLLDEDLIITMIKAGQKVKHYETVRRRKNGELIDVSITVSPLYDKDKNVVGASKIARDVTERRAKDAALKATSERLELALTAAEMGDWMWNVKTDIVTFTPRGADIFGIFPVQEITWIELQKLLVPEDAELARSAVEEALSRKKHYSTQYRVNKPDGTRAWIAAKGFGHYDGNGNPVGMIGVVQDITQRKEQQETLEALNRLAPSFVSTLDLQTLIQLATDEATKLTGAAFGAFFYNALNADGQDYLLYALSGAPRESFEQLGMPRIAGIFVPTFKGEGTILLEDVTKDPRYDQNAPHDGISKGHLQIRSYLAVSVISRSGEVIGGLFFGHPQPAQFSENDARLAEGIAAQSAIGIDNARLYEQVKAGKERAEAASKAKSEFLANMSHEIRTPMNAIMGLSNILAISQPLTPKQQEYIKTLQSSANSLLDLINDLLDISKIEARAVELEHLPFSVFKIICDVEEMMSVRVQEKKLEFISVLETPALQKKIFVGDPTRLRQVIVNLCSNAVKFTDKGSITVEISSCSAKDPAFETLEIAVRDTGIGIAPDKIETIFEKFVQADGSINRKYGGTGLGLAITKTLTEAMGGTISVESEEGEGSVFIVRIPLKLGILGTLDTKALAEEQHHMDAAVNKGMHVLLVEDHEPNILVAGSFLENMGLTYDIARNGSEAVEKVKKEPYELVMMDIQMHGMNGLEATRTIRAHERSTGSKRIPIIGVTAHAMAGDRERCLGVGMDDYLSKPFNGAELASKLEKFLDLSSR